MSARAIPITETHGLVPLAARLALLEAAVRDTRTMADELHADFRQMVENAELFATPFIAATGDEDLYPWERS